MGHDEFERTLVWAQVVHGGDDLGRRQQFDALVARKVLDLITGVLHRRPQQSRVGMTGQSFEACCHLLQCFNAGGRVGARCRGGGDQRGEDDERGAQGGERH